MGVVDLREGRIPHHPDSAQKPAESGQVGNPEYNDNVIHSFALIIAFPQISSITGFNRGCSKILAHTEDSCVHLCNDTHTVAQLSS